MGKSTGKGHKLSLIVENMKVNGRTAKSMVWGLILFGTAMNIMEHGKMTKNTVKGLLLMLMVMNMKVNGRTAKHMV